MDENIAVFPESRPIELSSTQQQVLEILRAAKSPKYSLGDWYLGAIYAAKNTYNPDRFSQAAQSLRELLEKLPRVFVESEIPVSMPNFRDMRTKLYSQLCADKERYEDKWQGKVIDKKLDKTICDVDNYLKLNQTPTRKEQIHSVIKKLDPMHETLDQEIRSEKAKRFHSLWENVEGFAHHNNNTDEKLFWEQLAIAERLIIDLLAPITAQDQCAIRAVISKPHPEQADFEKLLELIKRRGANYAFFFNTADNPAFLTPLVKSGFFKDPPNVKAAGDGHINIPLWHPIFYLKKVAVQSPEKVVKIILDLKKTNNPRILHEIFSIACDLPDIGLSLQLKQLIKRFLQSSYRWDEDALIVKILQKWGSDPGSPRRAALEILQCAIAFQADPKAEEKRSRRKENLEVWETSLEPAPRFDRWEYQQILERGVRPLSEFDPYQVARIMIDTVASMIHLSMHQEDLDKGLDEDYSEIWCERLDEPSRDHHDAKSVLVHTLTYACRQVYDKIPESIDALDQALRKKRWKIFKRLRQLLYASHPSNQTLPWIRELILKHGDYSKWEHHYEFQLMVRKACEHFGQLLLSEAERSTIFDAIHLGPPKGDLRQCMGESYSDETFKKYQRHFHRMQLRPFLALLNEKNRRYFDELNNETLAKAIADDSFSPRDSIRSGIISYHSPQSAEELVSLTDEELLAYLNDWDDEHHDKNDWLVEISISALSEVFYSVFKEKIIPEWKRLAFWMEHRDEIARPIYVVAMVNAMQSLVKDKNFGNLGQWIEFCLWILSHPDTERVEGKPEPQDKSREQPDWGSSRRAVVDFIDVCVGKDTNAPIEVRDGLASLLRQVCAQPSWRLDCGKPVFLNYDDPITEAINNNRSRALESLVNFGFWIRRQHPGDTVPEVTNIITKRIGKDAEIPLTRPEYAILGMYFASLACLNKEWAIKQRWILFPQDNIPLRMTAFGSYIRTSQPNKGAFELLRGDFEYALDNLDALMTTKNDGNELVKKLGQHLFIYYLWQLYPLAGNESLLECFYNKTKDDQWALLFDHVGRSLEKSGKNLDKTLIERAIAYFEWRLEAAVPLELQKFTFWLEAECLEPMWRLSSFSKILDLGHVRAARFSMELRALNKLLPVHVPLVVECFAKITDAMLKDPHVYVSHDEAKSILKSGLNDNNEQTRKYAERAKNNLLQIGCADFLDVE